VNGDGTRMVSSPSEVHCNRCDHLNLNVDIFDDLNTGDWAYIFECSACEHINDEHGTREDRGAITPAASFWLFAAAVVGIVLFLYQPVIFWTLIGVIAYCAVLLGIIGLFMGSKQGEHRD